MMVLLDLSLTDPKLTEKVDDVEEGFLCAVCKAKISEKRFLVAIGGAMPFHVFTNPHGFSFRIVTVRYCEMVKECSRPTHEFTWFPGYSWSIINCASCNEHLGWKFFSGDSEPCEFYGLIRDKILFSIE